LSKDAKKLQAQILDVAQAIHKTEQQRVKKGDAIEKDANAARARGFAILLLFLHTYVIHDNELVGALEDLLECWKRIDTAQTTPSKKDKRKSKDAMEVEEEPEPMAVLVDILISFLTKSSSQLRDLVTRTFRLFASRMTSSSCQALVEVVTGKRDSTLFGIEDEDDEEEVEEDEDEHDDDDEDSEEDEEDDDDEDEDDEDEEKDEDEESKPNTSLDTSKNNKSSDSEEDEEEEELLDDAAMFKMDEKIVAVLKNMKEKKTNERDARESVKHFKCRVLDLLEIFVKRQHDSHLIPEMIGPLAAAVRDSVQNKHQQELSTKLAGFLKRLFKSKQCVCPLPVWARLLLLVLVLNLHAIVQLSEGRAAD
jgi:DNA polymerase phi